MKYSKINETRLIIGIILVLLLIHSEIYAIPDSCTMPNCAEGNDAPFASNSNVNANADLIVRTYLPKQKKNLRRTSGNNNNPDLAIYIDEADMVELFEVGSKCIRYRTEPQTIVNLDVGFPGNDIQYWDFNNVDLFIGTTYTSIDPSSSPYIDSFPGANIVYKGLPINDVDSAYGHFELNADEYLQLGLGADNLGAPYILDWFETEAFLPIEFGWEIDETITSLWALDSDIDSMVEHKNLVLDATGYMTPINENPVPAILAFILYDRLEYKNGSVVDSFSYDAFVWFSEEGHRVFGILADTSATDGMAQFTYMVYEKNVKPCGQDVDLGVDPFGGVCRAEFEIKSGAEITNGPLKFIAGQGVELKPGFSTTNEFEIKIEVDPCN